MKRKLTLLTNFVQSVLVAMFFLFSIGEIRAQLPYSSAHFGAGNTATINGVKVTRIFQGNVVGVAPANRLSAANGYCAGFPSGARYAIVNTAGNGQIVYVFNEPVKEVDVDLIGMGRKNDSSKEG